MPWFWVLLWAGGLVWANPLLVEGRFAEAYQQGRTAGGAGWLLAAQAANLHASYIATGDSEIGKWFALGQEAAQRMLEFNAQSAEAHFELARSIGGQLSQQNLLGRAANVSVMRDHLQQALRLRPDYPEARAALAVWHLEVAQAGVGWLYGANIHQVRPLFEEALRLEPNSILIRVWYAQVLVKLGAAQQARIQFEHALRLTPRNAVEVFEQGFARERLHNLR
ncbi:hypothetical protein [Meiothermus sp.]|uniref:hypothetical protein n=1 Tax=Meiothermus sp. TaxID=1955249 RepID=UPI00307DAA8D